MGSGRSVLLCIRWTDSRDEQVPETGRGTTQTQSGNQSKAKLARGRPESDADNRKGWLRNFIYKRNQLTKKLSISFISRSNLTAENISCNKTKLQGWPIFKAVYEYVELKRFDSRSPQFEFF